MRVYLEKPRTTIGWKGFLYDPGLNGESDLAAGLTRGRELMVRIAELEIPIATEILDPLAADYFEDCLSWVAIGARTAESQIHRQLASGLECAVGFKNGTDGGVRVATQAMEAAAQPHAHLGIDAQGRIAMKHTTGNRATHVVLRGGDSGPNYGRDAVSRVADDLRKSGKRAAIFVDCSHGNSEKDYRRQPEVARTVMSQMNAAHADVFGLMLESHLVAGKQAAEGSREYGVSVTDGCIDFATTEALLLEMAAAGSGARPGAGRSV
jgi:3-deoxy-7-phosphoheptulonate synthase